MSTHTAMQIGDQQIRKRSNKPMMERRRRERINRSLDTLKELILKAENKDSSKYSKLEKADILEMAVRHLQNFHGSNGETMEYINKYRAGFSRCTSEVESFMRTFPDMPSEVIHRLMSHLNNHMSSFAKENIPQQQSQHKIKATIDKSILQCQIVKKETETRISYQQHSPLGSSTDMTQGAPDLLDNSYGAINNFPLSPPAEGSNTTLDSNPNSSLGFTEARPLDYAVSTNCILFDRSASILTCNYLPAQEGAPLNLTVQNPNFSNSRSRHRPILPRLPDKDSGVSLPPSPPSERSSPTLSVSSDDSCHSADLSTRSHRCKVRSVPYPKKDAAKRYQIENQQPAPRPHSNPSTFHWRPW